MKVSERVRRQVKLSKVLHFSLCSVFKCINKVHEFEISHDEIQEMKPINKRQNRSSKVNNPPFNT